MDITLGLVSNLECENPKTCPLDHETVENYIATSVSKSCRKESLWIYIILFCQRCRHTLISSYYCNDSKNLLPKSSYIFSSIHPCSNTYCGSFSIKVIKQKLTMERIHAPITKAWLSILHPPRRLCSKMYSTYVAQYRPQREQNLPQRNVILFGYLPIAADDGGLLYIF